MHPSIVDIAQQHRPQAVCIVPEKRQELTTEGGLDVVRQFNQVKTVVQCLQSQDMEVSLFIDADAEQIQAATETTAKVIELHTGDYAEQGVASQAAEAALAQLVEAAELAHGSGLKVNAGHGLNYENTQAVLTLPYLNELNIGHAIVARALMVGMAQAVMEMRNIIDGVTLE